MNDQLVSHIKVQLAQNKSRDDIVKELLNVGWKQEDLDAAFSVAQEAPQPSPASPPPVRVEQSPVASVVSDTNSSETYSAPINMSATTAPVAATADGGAEGATAETKLPGVFALLKGGFAIYKDRLGVLVGIGAMQLLFRLLFVGIVLVGIILGATVFFLHSIIMTIILAVVALLLGIGIVWLLYWITLASWQAVRGHKEKVTFRAAFGSTRHLVWSFLWLLIVVMLVSTGGIFLLSL
ncbi:MAG TPA: hypothetical protein ENI56_01260, partial [Candidatus Kaiserbacteria bacterium]|nr:hypothetical protein [Candidatus Kaiserbacteria bacterium]